MSNDPPMTHQRMTIAECRMNKAHLHSSLRIRHSLFLGGSIVGHSALGIILDCDGERQANTAAVSPSRPLCPTRHPATLIGHALHSADPDLPRGGDRLHPANGAHSSHQDYPSRPWHQREPHGPHYGSLVLGLCDSSGSRRLDHRPNRQQTRPSVVRRRLVGTHRPGLPRHRIPGASVALVVHGLGANGPRAGRREGHWQLVPADWACVRVGHARREHGARRRDCAARRRSPLGMGDVAAVAGTLCTARSCLGIRVCLDCSRPAWGSGRTCPAQRHLYAHGRQSAHVAPVRSSSSAHRPWRCFSHGSHDSSRKPAASRKPSPASWPFGPASLRWSAASWAASRRT